MLYASPDVVHAQVPPPEVLIVGAGTVGLVLGIALARAGRRVTVLEAGPREPGPDFRRRNKGIVAGRAFRGLLDGRMKAVGGTTRLWGGQLAALSRADFDRQHNGVRLWPVTYNDIAPYAQEAARFLSISDDENADDDLAWRTELEVLDLRSSLAISSHLWLPDPDFAKRFRSEIETSPKLTVIANHEVIGLGFGENRDVHAVAECADGSHRHYTADAIVLANGTLEISRLLLRAAALAPGCPFQANSMIGRGFLDHLHGVAGRLANPDTRRLRRLFETRFSSKIKRSVKIRASERHLREVSDANCAASFIGTASLRQYFNETAALIRRVGQSASRDGVVQATHRAWTALSIIGPFAWSYLVDKRGYNLFGNDILIGLEVEQLPSPRSRLFLDTSAPPETAEIAVDWQVDGYEMRSILSFMRELKSFLQREALGQLEIDPRIIAGDPAYLDDCQDAYHHIGGARIGTDARSGVVDGDLKVFGTRNLWVLGPAVFPTGGFANPTLTALAFALRLAARLGSEMGAHIPPVS